ncbi:MAG TPA: cell wall hydrolase [Rhizomicrobium sp.]|nr:cell wall hydrolase [Rhizomicrobium sp.]
MDELLAQHRCLAQAMYYEARGEGEAGELAVAEVVVRRLRTGRYGSTICAVVYAGAPRPGCQFSFACDGSLGKPNSRSAWRAAEVLATKVFAGELPLGDSTGNALNYHAVYVHPAWADRMVRTARIGRHVFLGPAARSPRRSAV